MPVIERIVSIWEGNKFNSSAFVMNTISYMYNNPDYVRRLSYHY